MNTVTNFSELPALNHTVLTLGAFDGVHLGHQGLIRQTVQAARMRNTPAWVVTFDPLPRQVFSGGADKQLTTLSDRLSLIAALGVDGTLVLPFNRTLITQSASAFVAQIAKALHPLEIWVGQDFRFGADQAGDYALLQALSERYNYTLGIFDEITLAGDPVRSSHIRTALLTGNLEEANALLGRPYHLTGAVGRGDQRGRTLGFPTANLMSDENVVLPSNGVYVCRVHMHGKVYPAITNVGTRPTFNNRPPTVEAHILDFSGDIYGETIKVDFLHRLRDELKFSSVDELIAQMNQDKREACRYFVDCLAPA